MTDEHPVTVKKRKMFNKTVSGLQCVLHFDQNKTDFSIKPINDVNYAAILKAVSVRQNESNPDLRLDSICSKIPQVIDHSSHGFHRWCYCRFTNVARILQRPKPLDSMESLADTRSSGRRVSSEVSSTLFPQNQCLFCDKEKKKLPRGKGAMENLVKCVEERAEASIKDIATRNKDFLMLGKISGVNLRAKEARYHESCRRNYVRKEPTASCSTEKDMAITVLCKNKMEAYSDSFENLCLHIQKSIVVDGNVERMAMLKDKFLNFIKDNSPQHYNADYKTCKLKDRVLRRFGDKLEFWRPQNNKSEIVFSSDIQTGEAVEVMFDSTSSQTRLLNEAATVLRQHILGKQAASNTMSWPPTTDELRSETYEGSPPTTVVEFLIQVITGKSASHVTDKTCRLTQSFAEDICSAATRGTWTQRKHVKLGVALHTMTGRADIVALINRYGHCCSYTTLLELENAMAMQIQQQCESLLPSNIAINDNMFSHLCWDNFDINEETPSGSGTSHTTHGIIIQEVYSNQNVNQPSACDFSSEPNVALDRKSKFKYFHSAPLPCITKKHIEPSLTLTTVSSSVENMIAIASQPTEQLWLLCKTLLNKSCTVPDWAGWVSKTCCTGDKITQSKIGYMAPILYPITDPATVQQCINTSMEVSRKLNQEYTFITMDLAAAKLAYNIIWDDHERYSKVIMHLGAFHTTCSYLGAIGKMMNGSGFEDIVLESGLCASGSIEQVLSGKHYNRSMRVHQRMLVALEQLIFEAFIDKVHDGKLSNFVDKTDLQILENLANHLSVDGVHDVLQFSHCKTLLNLYDAFKCEIRKGELGITAQFWLTYCDCIWNVLRFQRAIKTNDLNQYIISIRRLCDLIFSSDHLHYARYLPLYHAQLENLNTSHPGARQMLSECGISVSRSSVPGCRNAIDITIEQTINRSAKTPGGIIGFSRKPTAYYRWCLTRSTRAEYVEAALDGADLTGNSTDIHKCNRPSEIRKSSLDVAHVVTAVKQYMNPFATQGEDKQTLFCLSSGQPATDAVKQDLMSYVKAGEDAARNFICTRIVNKTVKFYDTLKKQNLKTFKSMAVKRVVTSSQKKIIQVRAERNLLGRVMMLSQFNNISLEKLFQYPLGPIPWSLATADGGMVKTDKSQLLHCLEDRIKTLRCPTIDDRLYIIDGNAHFQAMSHLPATFEDLALQIFNTLPEASFVHFVTDTYKENSIKQMERDRRGSSSTFRITAEGTRTKLPKDFKSFLLNANNKRQLISFLLSEWQKDEYARQLHGKQLMFVCEDKCYSLTSKDGLSISMEYVPELFSSHEEADTRLILHCLYASKSVSLNTSIVVRSPDTDVFVLLIHYSVRFFQPLIFDTGTGSNRRLIDIRQIVTNLGFEMSQALPAFHAFTGSDCTSAFVRKGKKGPLKTLEKYPDIIKAFAGVGTSHELVDSAVLNSLQRFVCLMYGKVNDVDTNKVRCDVFQARYGTKIKSQTISTNHGIDLCLLPPCKTSLLMHIQRVNYQSFIWKNAHVGMLEIPPPTGLGWQLDDSGLLSVKWTDGDIMPKDLVDILASSETGETDPDEYSRGNLMGTDAPECTLEAYLEAVEEEDEIDNMLDVIFDDEDEDE